MMSEYQTYRECLSDPDAARLARWIVCETSDENRKAGNNVAILLPLTIVLAKHPEWSNLGAMLLQAGERMDIPACARLFCNVAPLKENGLPIMIGILAAELKRQIDLVS